MQFKNLSSALLLAAATVQAQSSSGSSSPSPCTYTSEVTATSQADLDGLAKCKEIKGDVRIGGDGLVSAALANVEKIDGSLTIENATQLISFSADSLKTVTDSLALRKLTSATTISFGSLADVKVIELLTLPNMDVFQSNLKRAERITISDTYLESIAGFEGLENIALMDINNNQRLATINSRVKTISNSLMIGTNGRQKSKITFDNLVWANNITVRDVNTVSFKSLEQVNSSMYILETKVDKLIMKNLTKVGSSLAITDNDELTTLDFESLTDISGALIVANNTDLKQVDGFKNLQNIGNTFVASGDFNRFDLGNLRSVRGGARVESTASNFTCDPLNSLKKSGGIQGAYSCKSNEGESSSSSGSSSNSGSSTKGSDSKKNGTGDENSSSKNAAAGGFFVPQTSSAFMGAIVAVFVALL